MGNPCNHFISCRNPLAGDFQASPGGQLTPGHSERLLAWGHSCKTKHFVPKTQHSWLNLTPKRSVGRAEPSVESPLPAQGFGDTAKPLWGQHCPSELSPTLPFTAKTHHCALSKATFTGLAYFIYRDREVWAPGGEQPMQFWGQMYIFMNFWSTESCSRRHAGGGRVLL